MVIGNGSPYFAGIFQEDYAGDIRVLTDPDLRTYQALEMKRSLASSLGVRALMRGVGARRQGHKQAKIQGDATQQGGVYVIDTQGEFLYTFNSDHAGHHPELSDVLAVLSNSAPED